MNRNIGIGVIGMGWMGQVHSRAYRLMPDRFADLGIAPQLIVCADEIAARAALGPRHFGFSRSTGNWQELMDDPEVDIVVITAPNHLHLPVVRAAVHAGKHIFCEKPVGRNPDETSQIEHAARTAGVVTGVGYNYRWAPLVQYARQLIQEGKLGDLTHYRGRFFTGYGRQPGSVLSWRFRSELAGLGALGDLMSHVIDMAHALCGPINRVSANQHTFIKGRPLATSGEGTHCTTQEGGSVGEVTNEDYVGALVQFDNGARGTLEACRVIVGHPCEMAFEVNGTRGALSWNFERMNELNLYLTEEDDRLQGRRLIFNGPEHPHYARFYPGRLMHWAMKI